MPIFSRCRWSARCASRRTGWRPMSTRWWSAPHLKLPLSPGEPLSPRLSLGVARLARSSSGDIIFEETPCCRALVARNHWLRDLRTLSCEHDLTDEPFRAQIETAGKRSVGSWRGAATVWKQSAKLETARRRKTKHQNRRSKRLCLAGRVTPSRVNSNRCRLHNPLRLARRTRRRARTVTRNAIYTWSCIQLQHSLTRYLRQYSIDYSLSSGFRVIGILVSALQKMFSLFLL